jgi:hypothetical protein
MPPTETKKGKSRGQRAAQGRCSAAVVRGSLGFAGPLHASWTVKRLIFLVVVISMGSDRT